MNFADQIIEVMVSYYTGIACVLFLFIGHQLGHEILHLLAGGVAALATFLITGSDPTWMFVCMLFLGFFFLLPPMAFFPSEAEKQRNKEDPTPEEPGSFKDQFKQKQKGFQNGHKGWSKSKHNPRPQSGGGAPDLHTILGLQQGKRYSKAQLKRAFYKRAKKAHPDKGGSADEFNRLKNAYDELIAAK